MPSVVMPTLSLTHLKIKRFNERCFMQSEGVADAAVVMPTLSLTYPYQRFLSYLEVKCFAERYFM